MFFKIDGIDIPRVSTGSSTFVGSGQFMEKAKDYRRKFLNHTNAMLEILEASYNVGGRGFHVVKAGKLCDAAKIMKETYDDYIIIGSTFPGPDPCIEELIDVGAKIIFVHASVSDKKDDYLLKLLDDVASRGVIPGIAAHNPVSTLEFAFENATNIKAFLVPFNANGLFMGNRKKLENIVDNKKNFSFFGMKTLAAGKLKPKEAYDYISQHNICAAVIGMVTVEEAEISTKIALEALKK